MKKRILVCVSLICLLGVIFVLASCGHECVYGSKYGYDENNHWQVCIAAEGEGCTLTSNTQKHALVEDSRKEPTCDKPGELVQKCKCGYKKTSVIEPLGHDIEEEVVAPTCEKGGYTQVTCKITGCRYSDKKDITEPAHNLEEANRVKPTCKAEGYVEYVCKAVGCDHKEKVTVEALPHAFADKVIAPTCTEKGCIETRCLLCDEVKETKDEVEALGHDILEEVVLPTCTAGGYTSVSCKREDCEYTEIKDEVSAVPHNYVKTEFAPTCTEEGYTANVCKDCGDEQGKSDIVSARGHDYQRNEINPTCFAGGYTEVTCSRCDYTAEEDETEPLAHKYYKESDAKENDHYKVELDPTCTEEGIIEYKCINCKFFMGEKGTLPALGHITEERVVAPTCDENGETQNVCTVCLAKVSVVDGSVVSALGHSFATDLGENEVEGIHYLIIKKPTCTEKGTKHYICQRINCGGIAEAEKNPEAVVDVEPTDHAWQVIVEPWCGNGGKREFICTNIVDGIACTDVKDEVDDSKEYRHTYPENGIAVEEPTCVSRGKYKCEFMNANGSVCGEEFYSYEGDEFGKPTNEHKYDNLIETVAPTCIGRGYNVYGCSAGECGTTENRDFVDVRSHSISVITEFGSTTCDSCGRSFIDITSESTDFEQDKICMGCGNDPCTCEGVSGGGSAIGKPNAPMQITANEALTVTGVELSDGWHNLSIGYGLIILKCTSESTFEVLVYASEEAEPVEFRVSGSGTIVIDLYDVSTTVKVVITSTADAEVSFYKSF